MYSLECHSASGYLETGWSQGDGVGRVGPQTVLEPGPSLWPPELQHRPGEHHTMSLAHPWMLELKTVKICVCVCVCVLINL